MRHEHWRNADIKIHYLSLGEPCGRIEDFVQVRKLELAALHFDDGWGGHGVVRAESYDFETASSIVGRRKKVATPVGVGKAALDFVSIFLVLSKHG
jgi:hypothetical protein